MAEPLRHRQTKEAATDMFSLTATAPHLDSTQTHAVPRRADSACRIRAPRTAIRVRSEALSGRQGVRSASSAFSDALIQYGRGYFRIAGQRKSAHAGRETDAGGLAPGWRAEAQRDNPLRLASPREVDRPWRRSRSRNTSVKSTYWLTFSSCRAKNPTSIGRRRRPNGRTCSSISAAMCCEPPISRRP